MGILSGYFFTVSNNNDVNSKVQYSVVYLMVGHVRSRFAFHAECTIVSPNLIMFCRGTFLVLCSLSFFCIFRHFLECFPVSSSFSLAMDLGSSYYFSTFFLIGVLLATSNRSYTRFR